MGRSGKKGKSVTTPTWEERDDISPFKVLHVCRAVERKVVGILSFSDTKFHPHLAVQACGEAIQAVQGQVNSRVKLI